MPTILTILTILTMLTSTIRTSSESRTQDLRLITGKPKDLLRTIHVDDRAVTPEEQLANGFPIRPWNGQLADQELPRVIEIIRGLAVKYADKVFADVRQALPLCARWPGSCAPPSLENNGKNVNSNKENDAGNL